MSMNSPIVNRPASGRRSVVFASLAVVCLGLTAPAPAQEETQEKKTVSERIKEYWHELIAKLESGTKAAGDEYHKLKEEAAKASGPAREKLSEEMEVLSKKWAAAREKLAASMEQQTKSLKEEVKTLEEKADKASGPAREKLSEEMHKLHEQWIAARAKMEATLSSNLKSTREELETLKKRADDATQDAKAKLGPRMDRLKAEYHKAYEKLAAYLKADLEQTKEDMEKLSKATSDAAKSAREKLSKKYHELEAKIEELTKEKSSEESK
jgi:chromosome segregation ATPase